MGAKDYERGYEKGLEDRKPKDDEKSSADEIVKGTVAMPAEAAGAAIGGMADFLFTNDEDRGREDAQAGKPPSPPAE